VEVFPLASATSSPRASDHEKERELEREQKKRRERETEVFWAEIVEEKKSSLISI